MRNTSRAYAKAAFNYAIQHDSLTSWFGLITCLEAISHPILKSPHLTHSTFISALPDSISLSEPQSEWIRLLITHRHIKLLPRICEHFIRMHKEHQHVKTVKVITARALTDAEKQRFSQDLSREKTQLVFNVDPRIIGGVQIEHNGVLIDRSYANILNQLYRKK